MRDERCWSLDLKILVRYSGQNRLASKHHLHQAPCNERDRRSEFHHGEQSHCNAKISRTSMTSTSVISSINTTVSVYCMPHNRKAPEPEAETGQDHARSGQVIQRDFWYSGPYASIRTLGSIKSAVGSRQRLLWLALYCHMAIHVMLTAGQALKRVRVTALLLKKSILRFCAPD